MGKNFDIAGSISSQLPFFSCINIMFKKEYQKDISKYVYCKDFGTSPYSGSYGEQPNKWIQKVNIIKYTFAKIEENEYKKHQSNSKGGG